MSDISELIYRKRMRVVCFFNEDDTSHLATFPLSKAGKGRLTEQLKKDDALAVEAGARRIYYFDDQIKAFVGRIVLVDTYRFSVIAKSKKKTDKADALALAGFLKLDHLPEVPVPSERVRQLRHLLQARETLVGLLTLAEESGTRRLDQKWQCAVSFGICFPDSQRAINRTR